MKNPTKYIISLIIVASLFSCNLYKAKKEKKNIPETTTTTEKPEPKDQYRIAENYTGNKTQIIDLIAGPATFEIKYEGSSQFRAVLLNNNGSILDTLVNVSGSYQGEKSINVPQTTSYILDVKTKGVWSIYRK